jgi:serine protein kinase
VIAYLWSSTRRGVKVAYSSYEPLKQAIERKPMNSVRELSRIITKARTRDDGAAEIRRDGPEPDRERHPEDSIDTILKYAANHLWRD